jgi:hypothetical protein
MKQQQTNQMEKLTEEKAVQFDDYKTVSILPSLNEVLRTPWMRGCTALLSECCESVQLSDTSEPPYLRAIKTGTPYKSEDELIETHVRLMRDDYVRPLREGIVSLRAGQLNQFRSQVTVYSNVTFVALSCDRNGTFKCSSLRVYDVL